MKGLIAFAAALVLLAGCVSTTMSKSSTVPPPPAGPNVGGSWALTVNSPIGSNDSTAVFQQSGNTLSGTITNQFGEVPLTGTVDNTAVAFSITVDFNGQSLKLDYSGQVTDDELSGTVKFGDFGEGTWSGKKKS